jgi:hypothetical protein
LVEPVPQPGHHLSQLSYRQVTIIVIIKHSTKQQLNVQCSLWSTHLFTACISHQVWIQ